MCVRLPLWQVGSLSASSELRTPPKAGPLDTTFTFADGTSQTFEGGVSTPHITLSELTKAAGVPSLDDFSTGVTADA